MRARFNVRIVGGQKIASASSSAPLSFAALRFPFTFLEFIQAPLVRQRHIHLKKKQTKKKKKKNDDGFKTTARRKPRPATAGAKRWPPEQASSRPVTSRRHQHSMNLSATVSSAAIADRRPLRSVRPLPRRRK